MTTFTGNNTADTIFDGAGNDVLRGWLANNLAGNQGPANDAELLIADLGRDTVRGGGGNDTLYGGADNDSLSGGTGDDQLFGGAGNDLVQPSAGNDFIFILAGDGTDSVDGGKGMDYLSFDRIGSALGLSFSIADATLVQNLSDGTRIVEIEQLAFQGVEGNDLAEGGGLADLLWGDGGADTLVGGQGADMFDFKNAPVATGFDEISDFTAGEDMIRLDHLVFKGAVAGGLAVGAFVNGTVALQADHRVLYDASSGALWYDRDGSGAAVAVQFAQVTPDLVLVAADFSFL